MKPQDTGMAGSRGWRLRTHLTGLLLMTVMLTFTAVGAAIVLYRIPEMARENRRDLQLEVRELAGHVELLLDAWQTRLELLEAVLDTTWSSRADAILDGGVDEEQFFTAVYRVSPQGRIVAAGLPPAERARRQDLLGSDLSANALVRAVADGRRLAWSGNYLSLVGGTLAAAVALRHADGAVLVAEVSHQKLVAAVHAAAGPKSSSVWVVDHRGDIVADSGDGREVGRHNLLTSPLMRIAREGRNTAEPLVLDGERVYVATAESPALGWYFVGQMPRGLSDAAVRDLLLYLAGALAGCALIGWLVAWFWAERMARPLYRIVEHAERATAGIGREQPWPRGQVAEFNRLVDDLEGMAVTLQERELESLEIFNTIPFAMAVVDAHDEHRIVDVNRAWSVDFGYARHEAIGRNATELRLVRDAPSEEEMRQRRAAGPVRDEVLLRQRDGQEFLAAIFGPHTVPGAGHLLIWGSMDVGPQRRAEQRLRELNAQLEDRVAARTAALEAAHADLSGTVEALRTARGELVQAEKMAALGGLVAGVAHELNTPLGNGVMAISAVEDARRSFEAGMAAGLRRADLQQLVDGVAQGCDIAGRNLRRAAELVQSFKQVAVDQTSAQRRKFELHEVVHEMVVSLRPSLNRTPYRVEVEVPTDGLRMDSYPGALSQVVGNLIQNAVLHGFDGRDHGTVRIRAEPADADWVQLTVGDDGKGIAEGLRERIFDPFVTTRMGRGGTGLGLHISYNAVVNLLGGTIAVHSVEGEGSCFTLRLPRVAPRTAPDSAARERALINSRW